MRVRISASFAIVLLLAGCASSPPAKPDPGKTTTPILPEPGRPEFGAGNIPEPLLLAVEDTYRKPEPMDCATIAAQVTALDAVLGADVDTLKAADVPGHVVAKALGGAIKGLIPYSGVIRLLSGQRQRERKVAEAIAAGAIRRGYLKGMGEAAGCTVPASPLRP